MNGQILDKESCFYTNNLLFKIERAYILNSQSTLYCSYDGLNISFKKVDKNQDTINISWAFDKIGDKNICFCIESDKIENTANGLFCIKKDQKVFINNMNLSPKNYQNLLKEKNLVYFKNHVQLNHLNQLDLKFKEQQIFKDNRLVKMNEFENGIIQNTIDIKTTMNKVEIVKSNLITNSIDQEVELIWNKDKTQVTCLKKIYNQDKINLSISTNKIDGNEIRTYNDIDLAEKVRYKNKPNAIEILKNKIVSSYQNKTISMDHSEDIEIYSYENTTNPSKILINELVENGTHKIVYIDTKNDQEIYKIITTKSLNQVEQNIENYANLNKMYIED